MFSWETRTEPAIPMQMMTTGSFFAVCPSLVSVAGLGFAVVLDDSAILKDSLVDEGRKGVNGYTLGCLNITIPKDDD
jgi:hypothetical protein